MPSVVSLKVDEALQSDAGLGRARVDAKTRLALGVEAGQIVEIIGKRSTTAKLFQTAQEDDGKGIIRLDGLMRRNLRVSIGDAIEIRRAEVLPAKRVAIAPVISGGHRIQFGQGIEDFVKRGLLNRPVMTGDVVIVPGIALMGGALPFVIISVVPKGIVQIVVESIIEMVEEPVGEPAIMQTPAELYSYFASELASSIRRLLKVFDGFLVDMPGDKGEKARRLAETARKLADEAESEKEE